MAEAKSGMTLPQIAVAAGVGIALLWLFTGLMWFVVGADAWKSAEKKWKAKGEQRRREERMIARTGQFRDAYGKERTRMPEFADGEDLGSHWLGLVEEITGANGLKVASRRTIKGNESETREGDVCEQQIEIVKWESTLENLLRTMYAFESAKGDMIDIRKMTITPSAARKGFMGGSMSLTCAYTRKAKAGGAERKPQPQPAAQAPAPAPAATDEIPNGAGK